MGEGLDRAENVAGLGVFQTTIRNRICCTGIGLHSGKNVRVTMYPAEAGTGVVFRRVDLLDGGSSADLSEEACTVAARYDNVSETQLGTTVANNYGASVATVEHLVSALAGCGVDNIVIELDGPEVPVLDGSSAPYLFLIECAGVCQLAAPRTYIRMLDTVVVEDGDKRASLSPYDGFAAGLEIDFECSAIGRQSYEIDMTEGSYKGEIARARTFGFLHELEYMKSLGLARGGSLENAVVLDGDGIMNEEGLRYPDEFVRHKILDAIGDLYLCGAPIMGRFDGVRSGHGINNALLHALFDQPSAWEYVDGLLPASGFNGASDMMGRLAHA